VCTPALLLLVAFVRFLKIAIKAMSDPSKIYPLAKKVLELKNKLQHN